VNPMLEFLPNMEEIFPSIYSIQRAHIHFFSFGFNSSIFPSTILPKEALPFESFFILNLNRPMNFIELDA
jgi:hypothetical protein